MNSTKKYLAGCALFVCAAVPAANANPVLRDTIVSASRQFVIQAETREVRSRAASFAEELRGVWTETLGLTGAWEFPVRIQFVEDARQRTRQRAGVTIFEGDLGSLWVHLTVNDASLIGTPELAGWIFQALALEYAARFSRPAPNRVSPLAPQWLIQALIQQWMGRRTPPPAQIVEGLLSSPKPPTIASLLRQRKPIPSAADQLTFRLLSLGLLRTLAETPEGSAGLRALVGRLGEADVDQAAILRAFPSLEENPGRLERQWALTLARLAHTTRVRLLTFSATGRELETVFSLRGELPRRGEEPEELAGPLAMLAIARGPGGQRALTGLMGELIQLEMRSHPLYSSIIKEYRDIAQLLIRHPRSNVRKRIEENIGLQAQVSEMGSAIADELNAFEVNRAGVPDPAFQKMLHLQSALLEPEPRRDAISRALDSFESRAQK